MSAGDADIRLIIFDCDGVLVDSEPLANEVLLSNLKREGLSLSLHDSYERFLGRSLSSVLEILAADYGLKPGPDMLERMRHELADLFRLELKPVNGIAAALESLCEKYQVCVASSSAPERLNLSLETTGLKPFFGDRIFSATEVENGKPAPDLFLHAAKSCGVGPQHCIVIEDSPAGIAAAQAAGMRVFGFAGGSHVAPAGLEKRIAAAAPDAVFSDMSDLPGLMEKAAQSSPAARPVYVAVDVGTASVRAGVFAADGTMCARREQPITVWRQGSRYGEYASDEIWAACTTAVRTALADASARPEDIKSIAFDATCSLVVLDKGNRPLPISMETGAARDTIAWFDHRALDEALEISASDHPVLAHSGGALSPEMEIPKLMWLKRNRRDLWDRAGNLFDLADFLTFKATGANGRSQSTLTAKWNFLAHQKEGWDQTFFAAAGLDDLYQHADLPAVATPPGAPVGALTPTAAEALGLTTDCVVAAGMVDAHAGAVGVLGRFINAPEGADRHLGFIAGTSSCLMALSHEPRHIPGIWGPYLGAVAEGTWLNEGGQSATGALLDHVIRWHAAGGEPTSARHAEIVARITELRVETDDRLAPNLHVLPDFHGNRSPLHDPRPRGMIIGLALDDSFDNLCALYWRTAVSLALSLRQIVELMVENGYGGETIYMAGGHTHSTMLMELYADVTGRDFIVLPETDALLLGTAICAASAAEEGATIGTIAERMRQPETRISPRRGRTAAFDRDYGEFLSMQSLQRL